MTLRELINKLVKPGRWQMRNLARMKPEHIAMARELAAKPCVKPHKYPILVHSVRDGRLVYPDISFYNDKAIDRPKKLRPWGGKNPPKGYYNCNNHKYARYFAFGYEPWSKIIDTPVIKRARMSQFQLLTAVLRELERFGSTEEEAAASARALFDQIGKARVEVKAGKCMTIPNRSKKGFTVCTPQSVLHQLADLGKSE